MRKLAVYINATAQRAESFREIQEDYDLDLKMLQDVRQRWNSTYHMLVRGWRLQDALEEWMLNYKNSTLEALELTDEEWIHVRYIIALCKPFAMWTYIYSLSSGSTIHTAWGVYECLFNHLEDQRKKLQRKRIPWKRALLPAIDASLKTLRKYYSRTEGANGTLYNLGTILCPEYKLNMYDINTWEADLKQRYRREFL